MLNVKFWVFGAAMAVTSCAPAAGAKAAPAFRPCFIDWVPDPARCARVEVPLDYDRPTGRKLEIHVAVLPARRGVAEPDPLLVFTGGPGQAASAYGRIVGSAFHKVRENRDILLIDQRGTGRSCPLECPGNAENLDYSEIRGFTAACLKKQEVDVEMFTLENVVRDAEMVRQRLGYERLNIWGGSWGTRTAALYLRRYPERVRTMIVDGVLPPDVSLFGTAPASAQRAIETLFDDCASDADCAKEFPNLRSSLQTLLQNAETARIPFSIVNASSEALEHFKADRDVISQMIRVLLYSADTASSLPLAISRAAAGDARPIGALAASGLQVGKSMAMGATLSILCGEEVAKLSPEEAEREGAGTFSRDSYFRFWRLACQVWRSAPPSPDASAPLSGDVPVLALSGDLDPVTPPHFGERFIAGFPQGRHLTVPNTGHNTSYAGCVPKLIGEFIEKANASSLDASCLAGRKRPAFILSAAGPVAVPGESLR